MASSLDLIPFDDKGRLVVWTKGHKADKDRYVWRPSPVWQEEFRIAFSEMGALYLVFRSKRFGEVHMSFEEFKTRVLPALTIEKGTMRGCWRFQRHGGKTTVVLAQGEEERE